MTLKLKRTPGLYLVGFMCSGKTTVGRALADELGWCFIDLDHEIEREQGRTIADIFSGSGEEEFRKIESELLRRCVSQIEAGNPCVLALGGGAFAQPQNWETVENNGITIWLDCPIETIHRRLGDEDNTRPLSMNRHSMQTLYEARKQMYARADYRVDSDCEDPVGVVQQILRLPLF
ncbi:MAG: shikimate kinase [Acidobacteriaceae bacterium]|nr:shikimate kinase [Acidobacteriaceae bacterium]